MTRQPQIWFITDPHIRGHRLVARLRGFEDSTEQEEYRGQLVNKADTLSHDAQIAAHWDDMIHPDDIVYVMGDISINSSQAALDWIAERPGIKIAITGNHDKSHPGFFRNAWKVMEKWREVFVDIQPFYRIKLNGHTVLLSHLPYSGTGAEGLRNNGEEVEERGTQWRLPDLGTPLLHGHTHGPERAHVSDKGTPQLHVGLDAWNLRPVPASTVIAWLEGEEV